ncbi:MAG: alanine--glyoxylate aminotransferase family protein [Cyanobacteria bacterium J083]|nr:MAG: alanine--glyoxylate aminotransferase family protein [Cyanobacteria bacterium J083]
MAVSIPINNRYQPTTKPTDIPTRLLLGPGPCNVHPRVLAAMSLPPIGHLDPKYLELMDEVQNLIRYAWQTENRLTISVSGTGSAAMEATLANTVEENDVVLVGVKGYFGHRLVDMANRYRANVRKMVKPWGEVFSLEEIKAGLEEHRPKILALVQAETSTGVRQPLEGVAKICREYDCLLLVDTVTSLGGVPLYIDEWGIDLAYSCSQKGLGCPPGVAPFTMSARAEEKLNNRQSVVPNWYLDMSLLTRYWGNGRVYHHTAPINMNYALRECLLMLAEEGLEARWHRHQTNAELLWTGLEELGLTCHVPREYRLPTLTTVRIPAGVDGKAVSQQLLQDYNIEIAGGLGELGGKVWRIGLMGYNSRPDNVLLLLQALKIVLQK